ncbi:RNA polymerase II subunit A C-terminal domain phosphatase [Smittium culicis]|uniref:RNA polymerase II subunit A C-terminal domain phosphatase n=1 Tax=Smittium culicis TaxID=133412 RepID=A0A1R1Y8A9_9FUNG|nr:RNA polymerase II subunit A C-terminal domain phosphatase [Smittium culicis]
MEKEHLIYLEPPQLPATIKTLKINVGSAVKKGDILFIFETSSPLISANSQNIIEKDDILASALKRASHDSVSSASTVVFYSNFNGQVSDIYVSEGQNILSKNTSLLKIIEPCGHEIQFKGLCSLCGKDVTFGDYLSRATVNMSHDVVGLMVSNEEAMRIEKINADRLINEKKLSLILDLDQTLMHAYATEDPGFEDWLRNNYADPLPPSSPSSSSSPSPNTATSNPNPNTSTSNPNKELSLNTSDLQNPPTTNSSDNATPSTTLDSISNNPSYSENLSTSDNNSPIIADSSPVNNLNNESIHLLPSETSAPPENSSPSKDSIPSHSLPENPDSIKLISHKNSSVKKITSDIGVFQLPGSHLNYYIKLRPGLSHFLSEAKKKFELHIYTMGTRNYADLVASLIDPSGEYFGDRILSRDESGSLTHKEIRRLFPCDESMVVVVDDRADVWSWAPSLIKIKEYSFFAGVGDINAIENFSGPSTDNKPSVAHSAIEIEHLTEQKLLDLQSSKISEPEKISNSDSSTIPLKKLKMVDHDSELARITSVLNSVHRNFYSNFRELKGKRSNSSSYNMEIFNHSYKLLPTSEILSFLRKDILKSANITFSPSFPKYVNKRDSYSYNQRYPHKELSEVYRMAEQFGATCFSEINPNTTHIISSNRDSHNMRMAVYENLKKAKASNLSNEGDALADRPKEQINPNPPAIVGLEWLFDSICRWSWQDERNYLIFPNDKIKIYKSFPFDYIPIKGFDVLDEEILGFQDESISDEDEKNYSDYASDTDVIASNLVNHVDWEDVDRELNEIFSDQDSDEEFNNDDYYSNKNAESNGNSSGFEDVQDDNEDGSDQFSSPKRTKYSHPDNKLPQETNNQDDRLSIKSTSSSAVNDDNDFQSEEDYEEDIVLNENDQDDDDGDDDDGNNDDDNDYDDDDDDFSDLIQNLDNEISL